MQPLILYHEEGTQLVSKLHRGVLEIRTRGGFWQAVAVGKGAPQWVHPSVVAYAHPVPDDPCRQETGKGGHRSGEGPNSMQCRGLKKLAALLRSDSPSCDLSGCTPLFSGHRRKEKRREIVASFPTTPHFSGGSS